MNDELIRRSTVLRFLDKRIKECEDINCPEWAPLNAEILTLKDVRAAVMEITTVCTITTGERKRPLSIEDLGVLEAEHPDWKLYTEYIGDEPYRYRYGSEWVAMQLMMEGGYPTPEEAKLAWLREWEREQEKK